MVALLLLPLLFAGWLIVERKRAQSALAKYEAQLIAQGEKLTFAELSSPMPEGENKAMEFISASLALRDGTVLTRHSPQPMRLVAPGKAIVITKQESWYDKFEKKTSFWADAQADLEGNAQTLHELRALARSPTLRVQVPYLRINTPLSHLSPCKRAAQWLSSSSLCNLQAGKVDAAIDDIESIVLASRLLEAEPFFISHLVRLATLSIAFYHCWPICHADNVSDAQLARLQAVLETVDAVTPGIRALEGERLFCRDSIRTLRDYEGDISAFLGGMSISLPGEESAADIFEKVPYNKEAREAFRTHIILPIWQFTWSYWDELHALEEIQRLVEASRIAAAQRSAATTDQVKREFDRRADRGDFQSWTYWSTAMVIPGTSKAPERSHRAETQREMTVAALAIKRYQLRHAKLPERLDDLVPEFIRTVPRDWIDGQPLRYRREGSSFVLWSVGENRKDDGGKPDDTVPYNFYNGPDMVWPQPASAAEVEKYNESIKPKPKS